jgi:uncharacterized protein (TIGR02996 family)
MRTFVLKTARTERAWTIDVVGAAVTTTTGKAGAFGDVQTRLFATPDEARAAAAEMIGAQTAKGFVETTPADRSDAAAFERALRDDPRDAAPWAAYADYLTERGDPRGEFMQIQLALEDKNRPAAERKRLAARERELFTEYGRDWLGPLAEDILMDGRGSLSASWRWRFGFPAAVTVPEPSVPFAQALAAAPAARFLVELRLGGPGDVVTAAHPPRAPRPPHGAHFAMFELADAPWLRTLRVFQLGLDESPNEDEADADAYAPGLDHLVARMTRVEELHLLCSGYSSAVLFGLRNLSHLRVLRVCHPDGYFDPGDGSVPCALDVLARNPALGGLTHLLIRPLSYGRASVRLPLDRVRPLFGPKVLPRLAHLQLRQTDLGDEGVRELIAAGLLKRLRWLDLRHGVITDAGARDLAACRDARNLDHLDLSQNRVTPSGLAELRQAGVNAVLVDLPPRVERDRDDYYDDDSE